MNLMAAIIKAIPSGIYSNRQPPSNAQTPQQTTPQAATNPIKKKANGLSDLPPIFSPGIMRLSPVSVRPACLSR